MTGSEAVARIQEALGFRSDRDAEILARLKEAQSLLEKGRTLPSFLIEEDAELSVVAGTQSYAYPTNFIRLVEDEEFSYVDATSGKVVYLEAKDFDDAREAYVGVTAARPRVYVLRKNSIHIFPEPDAAYTLTYSYYKNDDVITLDAENGWLTNWPYLVIARAGLLMASDFRDTEAQKNFAREVVTWEELYMRENALQEDTAPRAFGGGN